MGLSKLINCFEQKGRGWYSQWVPILVALRTVFDRGTNDWDARLVLIGLCRRVELRLDLPLVSRSALHNYRSVSHSWLDSRTGAWVAFSLVLLLFTRSVYSENHIVFVSFYVLFTHLQSLIVPQSFVLIVSSSEFATSSRLSFRFRRNSKEKLGLRG